MRRWTPVIVSWEDAVTIGQAHSDDDFETVIRSTIGFFIRRTAKSITVCMEDDRKTKNPEADIETTTTIPIALVKEVITLRRA